MSVERERDRTRLERLWRGNRPATGGGGSVAALTDVQLTSLTVNQVLKWNGTKWVNAADNTGGGGGSSNSYFPGGW